MKYLISRFSFVFFFVFTFTSIFHVFLFSIHFPSFFCFHYMVFCSFPFSIIFSSSKFLNNSLFALWSFFFRTFHLFYIFKISRFGFRYLSVFFFSDYISFSSLSCFRSTISQIWFKVVLFISFSSFEAFIL